MQEAIIKDTKLTFVDPLIVERYATDLIILDDLTELNVPNDASAKKLIKSLKKKERLVLDIIMLLERTVL